MGERFGLAFGVAPEQVVGKFMVHRLHPHPFALVHASAFPVLRVNQVDTPVLEGLARRLAPVDVLVPFDTRPPDAVEAAELRDRAAKSRTAMLMEKFDEL